MKFLSVKTEYAAMVRYSAQLTHSRSPVEIGTQQVDTPADIWGGVLDGGARNGVPSVDIPRVGGQSRSVSVSRAVTPG